MIKKLATLTLFSIFLLTVLLLTQLTNAEENDIDSSSLSWQTAKPITTDANTSVNGAKDPVIAVNSTGKNVIVAFMRKTGAGVNQADPFYSQSNDYGKNWSAPARIHTSASDSLFVSVTFDKTPNAHAVWLETDKEIWYSKQNSWSGNSATKIYEATGFGTMDSPRIVASQNNNLDLVWSQKVDSFTEPNIYHARTNTNNPSWPASAGNTPIFNTAGTSLQPHAFVDKSNVLHLVWQEQAAPGFSINYSRYNGSSWSTPIKISDKILGISDPISSNQRNFYSPKVHVQGSQVLVTFENRVSAANQNAYFVSCKNSCTSVNNWSGSRVTTMNYSLNGTDPTFLKPSVVTAGTCPLVIFTSLKPSTEVEEHVRIGSGCESWSKNKTISSVDALVGTNKRAIAPSATTADGWYIQLAFEIKSGTKSHIYVTRNNPGLYLPMVTK